MLWSCRFSRCKKKNHFSVQLSDLNLSHAVAQMKKCFSNPCLGVSVFTLFMAEVLTLPTHVTSPSTTRSTTAPVRLLPPSLCTKGALTNKTHTTEARLERRHTAAPTVPESSYIQWMWVTLWQKTTWRHSMTLITDQSHLVLIGRDPLNQVWTGNRILWTTLFLKSFLTVCDWRRFGLFVIYKHSILLSSRGKQYNLAAHWQQKWHPFCFKQRQVGKPSLVRLGVNVANP